MTKEGENKALVLKAFDEGFNKRDDNAFERYWSPDYIQHSSDIEPGRDGLRKRTNAMPTDFNYENALIMAQCDLVMAYGRFSNIGEGKAIIVVNILRIENGMLAEHWDVIQGEVSLADSKSGLPMFTTSFRKY